MITLKQGLIETEHDLLNLNIIDWNRLNGSWSGVGDALQTIASFFVGQAYYTIIEHDLTKAPERYDWPGWKHVGDHPYIGRLYWNDFHDRVQGTLTFSDSPDFYGTIYDEKLDKDNHFWGDIGKVSPQAFAMVQKNMDAHDIWISIQGTNRQIIIEPMISIRAIFAYKIFHHEEALQKAIEEAQNCPYCHPEIVEQYIDAVQLPLL